MTDEMKLNDNLNPEKLNDEILENVTAGGYVTQNKSFYSSGDTPKYKVGEFVKIKYMVIGLSTLLVTFIVTGVSDTKNGGEFCKEFTYTVMKVGEHDVVLKNVYESCITRA